MSRLSRSHLAALLALLAFSLPLFHSLVSSPGLCTDDLAVHIHKAYALERLLESGHWFPRWSPDLARGYGYPLFNFYAPLSSYPLALLTLAGLPYPFAAQLLLVMLVWLAGFGMYLCARSLFGPLAGMAAAVAYLYAPYLGYDVFFRGALAEVLAWVWIPLCMWALRLAARRAAWRPAGLAAVCYAALIASHNLAALLATPLLGLWAVVVALETRQPVRLRYGAAALALGLGLAAAFWVPALAEQNLVRTDRLLNSPLLQYTTNFIQVGELLAAPQTIDPALANPSPPRALGLLTALFAASGALGLLRGRGPRLPIFFLILAGLGYAAMTMQASQPIWDAIPLSKFAQFPWRMLGPAAACAALSVGAGVRAWGRAGWPLALAAGVALSGGAAAWFTPTLCQPESDLRAAALQEGSYGYSEYLPVTVRSFPSNDAYYRQLAAGDHPDRLRLPGVMESRAADPLDAVYVVSLDAPVEATYGQFFYPGWTVTIDDQPAAAWAGADGLIRFSVPAGVHGIHVRLGETPLRLAADLISILAALALAVLWWLGGRAAIGIVRCAGPAVPGRAWPAMFGAGLIVSLVTLTFKPMQQRRFVNETVAGSAPVRASFAGGVEVYGVDLPQAPSGESLDVSVYAGVREKIPQRFAPAVTVEDEAGLLWSAAEFDFPRWLRPPFTANDWQPGEYALWARRVQLLPGTPPGTYSVWLTVYDADTNAVDSRLGPDGNPVSPRLRLGSLIVTRPVHSIPPDPAAVRLSDSLSLESFTADRTEARPGDTISVSLLWHAEMKPGAGDLALIELADDAGRVAYGQAVAPAGPGWPLADWQAGETWLGRIRLLLPATLADGLYHWQVSLAGSMSRSEQGRLRISAPRRVFNPPSVQAPVTAQFGDFARLTGYSLSGQARPGGSLTLVLVWQALATPPESYSVFVHLGDESGRLWTQSDGLPQNWSRPTTGWLPGEYVVDEHSLALPAGLPSGDYSLYVGLAEVITGARAPVSGPGATGDMRIEIGNLRVGDQ